MAGIRKTPGTGETRGVVYQFPGPRTAVPVEHAEPRDSAGLSKAARELRYADTFVEAAPDIRSERVRALKEQIANGTYRPDPREVAREILKRGL